METNMRRVALVSCSKQKVRTEPGNPVPARELYAPSHLFRMQLEQAQATAEHVFIISALHEFVRLDQPLEAYEQRLDDLTPAQRRAWGASVIAKLRHAVGEGPVELHVYAGRTYVEPLRESLPPEWRLVDPLAGLTLFQRRSRLRALTWSRKVTEAETMIQAAGVMPDVAEEVLVIKPEPKMLRIPALAVHQPGGTVFTFSVDGKLVPSFASISRVRREGGAITGYQRPEALAHIRNIRDYLESGKAMVPNAVVLAFDSRVSFRETERCEGVSMGFLRIPLEGEEHNRPGWVVDGQQRLAAVREAQVESFPLFCSAFITDSQAEQAEQFLLVNSTKPIPKGLIYELLPSTHATLPPALEARKLPATLLERLNTREGSPLRGIVRTVTCPTGVATDTGFLQALENSISDGVLHRYRNRDESTGEVRPDLEAMERWVSAWWGSVREVFPEEWGRKPKESRLLHGAGVVALSLLMDAVAEHLKAEGVDEPSQAQLARELARVKDVCAWSAGEWDFGGGQRRVWNQLQNTRQDVERLSRLLGLVYRERSRDKAPKRVRKPKE